jgi:hypothetical protein
MQPATVVILEKTGKAASQIVKIRKNAERFFVPATPRSRYETRSDSEKSTKPRRVKKDNSAHD